MTCRSGRERPRRPERIVSGGQTGVDRGALDAALELGISCGGWCPAGRLAEDGPIARRYPLEELPGGGYAERTAANVKDSDATLIVAAGPLAGGTACTLDCCVHAARPVLVVDATAGPPPTAADRLPAFVAEHRVRVLNVAGPRASAWAEAASWTRRLLLAAFGSAPR